MIGYALKMMGYAKKNVEVLTIKGNISCTESSFPTNRQLEAIDDDC